MSASENGVRDPIADLAAILAEPGGLDNADVEALLHDWQILARDDQLPPSDGPWRTWLVLGGRGAGKTRAGSEWVRAMATGTSPFTPAPVGRIALVAGTMHEARSVMVEGVSGLMAIHHPAEQPRFEPSKAQVVWPNGSIAQLFSAEDPDSLRGPQFAAAWVDEIAKWRHAEEAWNMLQMALRLGSEPRCCVTTTPRPVPILTRLMEDPTTVVARSRTIDNADNLAAPFIEHMQRRFAGTLLGRQELDGELITDTAGALWRLDWIEQQRIGVDHAPPLHRVVVAVDPPVTATATSDACGLIVAGLGADGRAYVVADRTIRGREPSVWARAAIAAYRDFEADRIVAEVNQGGDMVESVLRQVDPAIPLVKVRATRGKWVRAEPVAALYAEGRVIHVGRFAELEAQMQAFGLDGRAGGRSPDRVDALVWALTELLIEPTEAPRMRRL